MGDEEQMSEGGSILLVCESHGEAGPGLWLGCQGCGCWPDVGSTMSRGVRGNEGGICCALLSVMGACDFRERHVLGTTPLDDMI